MKILHLLSNHYFTGPAEPVFGLIRAQLENGQEVSLCVDRHREGNIVQRANEAGIPLEERLVLSAKAGPLRQLADLLALRRIFKAGEYDIVHCHKSHEHTLSVLARSPGSPTRIVRTINKPSALRPGRRWLLRRSDGILTTAERQRLELIGRAALEPDRVLTLHGFTDFDTYRPRERGGEFCRSLGLSAQAPVAGIVARIKKNRNHDLLLDAWHLVAQSLPAARLLIAGRGEYAGPLRRRIDGSGLADCVQMVGYYPDLPGFYAGIDVMALLAPGNDGTCRAGIQAMAVAKPLVGLRGSSLEELIDHGRTGLLCDGDDAGSLADALVRLLSDRDQARRMGSAALDRARKRFTLERHMAQVDRLYRRITSVRSREAQPPAPEAPP